MRLVFSLVSALALTTHPVAALAGDQFVTAESVRVEDAGQVVASISVGNTLEADADGFYAFDGQVLASNGKVIPLTISVQTAGREEAPTIEEFAEATGRIVVTGNTVFQPQIDGVEIEKTIYTLINEVDGATGSITITDEPLPAIAGWLAFAALASFTGLGYTVVTDEDDPCEKISVSVSADLGEMKGEITLTCERL